MSPMLSQRQRSYSCLTNVHVPTYTQAAWRFATTHLKKAPGEIASERRSRMNSVRVRRTRTRAQIKRLKAIQHQPHPPRTRLALRNRNKLYNNRTASV